MAHRIIAVMGATGTQGSRNQKGVRNRFYFSFYAIKEWKSHRI